MKRILLTIFVLVASLNMAQSQSSSKSYTTYSGELIFSWADYKIKEEAINTPLRFTCFFHLGGYKHFDFAKNLGLYTGLAIRNVGFTSTTTDSLATKVKRRQYTLGVPLAIKIGDLGNDTYLYAGGEGELAFHYKEKTFYDDVKQKKEKKWFSNRTNLFLPSVFVGVNFKGGANLKFKYYLQDFYDTEYMSGGVKKYGDVTSSRMMYISFSMNVRSNAYSGSNKSYNKGS